MKIKAIVTVMLLGLAGCATRESELDREVRKAQEQNDRWVKEMNSPEHRKKVYDDMSKSTASDPRKSLRIP